MVQKINLTAQNQIFKSVDQDTPDEIDQSNEQNKTSFKAKFKGIFKSRKEKQVNQKYDDYAIYIKAFTKKFKKFKAVDNATIKVKKGTIHGFIGPNGSGKTTTIKCLISAMVPSSGELLIHGQNSGTVAAKKHVGYIPEAARFPRKISAYDYLVSMAQVSGVKAKEARSKAQQILMDLKLWDKRKVNPNNYSSGMKKKLLLAESLLNNPDVLILDEPAANLDPTARTELFNELKKLREQGKTVFISSHILSELQTLADEITILNYSKVVFQGTVNQTGQKYQINTTNNKKFLKLLLANKYHVEVDQEYLLVEVSQKVTTDLNIILALALKEKITITFLKPYILDLQEMYEKIVMANKPEQIEKPGKLRK
ncbi:MAG: ABC transporter ATP-binding protein [Spiroplasma sp.]|nr:ABC transporter ATP-binding protein [Spiroplasma sp.]